MLYMFFAIMHVCLETCRQLNDQPSIYLSLANITACLMLIYFMLSRYLTKGAVLIFIFSLLVIGASCAPAAAVAQNLGSVPAIGYAVQGETAAQPEGTLLNAMNWLGNVICPVAAGGTLVGTVAKASTGGKWVPWAVGTGGLLSISGGLRLMEFFVQNGRGGVL